MKDCDSRALSLGSVAKMRSRRPVGLGTTMRRWIDAPLPVTAGPCSGALGGRAGRPRRRYRDRGAAEVGPERGRERA